MNIDEYISKGFDIIPCQKNSKQPKGLNWQDQITDKNKRSISNLDEQGFPKSALPMRYIPPTIKDHVDPLPIHFNGLIISSEWRDIV